MMRIGRCSLAPGMSPMVIAEIGVNHLGDYAVAVEMIVTAAKCGAHAIKLQRHIPSSEMTTGVPHAVHSTIARASFSFDDERSLKKLTEDLGLVYLSTPFSVLAVQQLVEMGVVAFKVGSGEVTHVPMLTEIAKHRLPVLLSTGMATFTEIWTALQILDVCPVILMHCVSMYPTPYTRVQLRKIDALRREFGVPVGISDHSEGICIAFGAVAHGARVIEKHFMLEGQACPDSAVSITPQQLTDLVRGAGAVHSAEYGSNDYQPFPEELEVAKWARHSVTTLRPVAPGDVFTADNLGCKRPGTGLAPARLADLMGKLAARELPTDTQITEADYT